MKNYLAAVALGAAILSTPAMAQDSNVATPVAATVAPNFSNAVLRTGTPVPLKMSETLTTKGKKLKVGYRVRLEVAEDVRVNDVVVIPVGTPAVAEVTDVRNKGMWGKSGKINAQILYATVNGRQIRLSGSFDDKGTTGTAGVVGAIAFVPVAGFFMTGTSAEIKTGAPVKAFVNEDVAVNLAAPAPQPTTVVVPTVPAPLAN